MALIGFRPGKNVVGSAGIAMLVVMPNPLEISLGMYAALHPVLLIGNTSLDHLPWKIYVEGRLTVSL